MHTRIGSLDSYHLSHIPTDSTWLRIEDVSAQLVASVITKQTFFGTAVYGVDVVEDVLWGTGVVPEPDFIHVSLPVLILRIDIVAEDDGSGGGVVVPLVTGCLPLPSVHLSAVHIHVCPIRIFGASGGVDCDSHVSPLQRPHTEATVDKNAVFLEDASVRIARTTHEEVQGTVCLDLEVEVGISVGVVHQRVIWFDGGGVGVSRHDTKMGKRMIGGWGRKKWG